MRRPVSQPSADDIAALAPVVRTALAREGVDHQELDDLAQETLTRLLEVRPRLEAGTLAAYAIATARNLARSSTRAASLAARHRHRLVDLDAPPDPSELVVLREEARAFRTAVDRLPVQVREDLVPAAAGAESGAAGAARRSRLRRARAHARVEYVLAYRRAAQPSPRCRDVLEAISLGDRRQQERAGAADHLLACPGCAGLADPLLRRGLPLAAVVPVPVIALVAKARGGHLQNGAAATAATAAAAAAVAGATVVALHAGGSNHTAPAPAVPLPHPSPAAIPVAATLCATVHFASGSSELGAAATSTMASAAQCLRIAGAHTAIVTGFTDDTSGERRNDALARSRAEAVAHGLTGQVDPRVVVVVQSAGESDAVAANDSAAGRAMNRRVTIVAG